jgi:succinate dehydrogenase / fumarate reductase flavoprotein subunit
MGGLWVDFKQMTNIPGLFAAGECEYQYHGANRLGANSLLSSIYGGMIAGPNTMKYINGKTLQPLGENVLELAKREQIEKYEALFKMNGPENPFTIYREMGDIMTENVTIIRYNDKLKATDIKLQELRARWENIGIGDTSNWSNQNVTFVRQLKDMLELARVITLGALNRNESRGAHYKPEFPERDDANFLKTTKARFTPQGPELSYEEVDTSLIKPRARRYDVEKKEA